MHHTHTHTHTGVVANIRKGGILGTYYIVINILTVPKHGAGTVLSIFVCAQVSNKSNNEMACRCVLLIQTTILGNHGMLDGSFWFDRYIQEEVFSMQMHCIAWPDWMRCGYHFVLEFQNTSFKGVQNYRDYA